jgi:glycosyltransferase involved in cell wall biosynthesis
MYNVLDRPSASAAVDDTRSRCTGLSIITPAFNEAENLPALYERLAPVLDDVNSAWEWIIVDDHSMDATFHVIRDLASRDRRVRGVRFARNSGSHAAITYGLHQARGGAAAVIAADLQDPPEVLPSVIAEWRQGAQVVWASRGARPDQGWASLGFARLYYAMMRRLAGMHNMPVMGADFFLVDRRVLDALKEFGETNSSVLALITWMGFRQTTVTYDKAARGSGRSGWSLEKKIKLVLDSITAWTYFPIRLMSYVGFAVALVGFLYAAVILAIASRGNPVEGWSSLMIVVLVVGGIQMIMMGVLGEYLWRALDEARRRPRFLIEAATDELGVVPDHSLGERGLAHP